MRCRPLGEALTAVGLIGLILGCTSSGAVFHGLDAGMHDAVPPLGEAGPGGGGAGGGGGADGGPATGLQFPGGLSILAGLPGGVGYGDEVGRAARFGSPVGVADDRHGHLYIADEASATVRRLDLATGVVSTVAGAPSPPGLAMMVDGVGTSASFQAITGIAYSAENLYVIDLSVIRRIDLATGSVTTLAGAVDADATHINIDGVGTAARFYHPTGLVADNEGNLFVADPFSQTIRKIVIATAQVTTFAGQVGSVGVLDGIGTAAHAASSALAFDGQGALYALGGSYNLLRIDLATAAVTTLLDLALPASPRYLSGIASDGAGNVFISDLYNHVILKTSTASLQVTVLAGVSNVEGSDDGPPPVGHLSWPAAVAFASDGAVYVADRNNGCIRRVDVATGTLTTVAGTAPHTGSTDGVKDQARFKAPLGIATDGAANLFVADSGNFSVRRLALAMGAVTTVAGDPRQYGTDDGVGAAALFRVPVGVASDGAGNLFVVDKGAFTLRRIALATAAVSTFVGMPFNIGGNDGVGTDAHFWTPAGIASDPSGTLYVTDANAAVRKIDPVTAQVTTVLHLMSLSNNLSNFDFVLENPVGIAADGLGNVYLADADLHIIAKVVLATETVTTLAGSRGERGSADGVGGAARFNAPIGLALDGRGHLFVAEPDNHVVRRITIDTAEVTTYAGVAGEAGMKVGPLPGRLNAPVGLTVLPSGDLLISDRAENVILVAH